jgi:hypothetical protein
MGHLPHPACENIQKFLPRPSPQWISTLEFKESKNETNRKVLVYLGSRVGVARAGGVQAATKA